MLVGLLSLTESNWTRPQRCTTHLHLLGCQQPIKDGRMCLLAKGLGSWQNLFAGKLDVLAFWQGGLTQSMQTEALRLNSEHAFDIR